MQQIIYFFRKYKYFLLFILLEIVAFIFTLQSHSYHKSKFINSANSITGGVFGKMNSVSGYLKLKTINEDLAKENNHLKNQLAKYQTPVDTTKTTVTDTTLYHQRYAYYSAKIINNQYTGRNNTLTINKGSNHGITPDMAVINEKGIIGKIDNVSGNYATVLSILNSNSQINVRLKNNFHYGTLVWNGKDYRATQLLDIERQAVLKIGDTIISGGKSTIFPEGVPVGTISKINLVNNRYNSIDIHLFNDMSNLGYVYIIENLNKLEIKTLESSLNDE